MSFFESELVQDEMEDIYDLQFNIYVGIQRFTTMSREEKINHINTLSTLLDKQQILYTRLSLSNDPEAIKMKEQIQEATSILGFGKADMNVIFNSMKKTIESLKKTVHIDT
jgi:hypothetical protein